MVILFKKCYEEYHDSCCMSIGRKVLTSVVTFGISDVDVLVREG